MIRGLAQGRWAALILLAAACRTAGETGGGAIPPFNLEDQDGRLHAYEGTSDRPVVILVSSREGVESNKAWDRWLMNGYGDRIRIYRILNLAAMPRLFAPIVRSRVRENVDPPGIAVLLDFDGLFASLLPLSQEASTVLIVDERGRIASVVRGKPEALSKGRIAEALKRLGVDSHGE